MGMKAKNSPTPEERKLEATKDQEIVIPDQPASSHPNDQPLFDGHPEGNVEKLIEHGRQMGF